MTSVGQGKVFERMGHEWMRRVCRGADCPNGRNNSPACLSLGARPRPRSWVTRGPLAPCGGGWAR
eukprot:11171529-Lingulodinium_polyedra.AAC.1